MRVEFKLSGAAQLSNRLRKMPIAIRREMKAEVQAAGRSLETAVDARAPFRRIAQATTTKVSRGGQSVTVGLNSPRAKRRAFFWVFFETGSDPHPIAVKRPNVRMLVTKAGEFLGRSVRHPGVAARPFFWGTVERMRPEIAKRINRAITRALKSL